MHKEKSLKPWLIFAVVSFTVFAAWSGIWTFSYFSDMDLAVLGQSGDMFGSLNALFTGLAFAGLVSTLIMQRGELELQRKELELSRTEYALQRFENTLFGLIKQFNDHVGTIERIETHRNSGSDFKISKRGREVIREIAKSLPNQIYTERNQVVSLNDPPPPTLRRTLEDQNALFRDAFDRLYEPDFAPYMRLLYGIFRHIDLSNLSDDRKKMYSRIARASLSSSEVKFIMFDCASGVGVDFRPWVEKYGLLKHLPKVERDANPDLVALYNSSAFEPIAVPHTPM